MNPSALPAQAPLQIGRTAPDFAMGCIDADGEVREIRRQDYADRWLILLFYPRDFSFVCPTELTAFSARMEDFDERNCALLGVSVDSLELHREWLTTPPAHGGLGPLRFPLGSDPDGRVAQRYAVWVPEKEVATRGLFIIDPEGTLQYAVVHSLSVGRSADEVLRVLDALRNGGLCPASWTLADGTIDPELALHPGRILGHYRIQKQLGSGTFGSVFAAQDIRLERMVALKVLQRNVVGSRDALMVEARAAAQLAHPNVCAVHAVDIEDGLPIIVMEYVSGRLLGDLIQEGLSPSTGRALANQIAQGVAVAHEHAIVHGDLKPANIMITDEGVAKVLDFGLARSQHAVSQGASAPDLPADVQEEGSATGAQESTETVDFGPPPAAAGSSSGGLRGTPAYMSPEQAMGQPSTLASDVFSLGLTLFEMLTGQRALAGRSLAAAIMTLRHEDVAERLASQVAASDRDLLTAMLSRDAARRPSMDAVARALGP